MLSIDEKFTRFQHSRVSSPLKYVKIHVHEELLTSFHLLLPYSVPQPFYILCLARVTKPFLQTFFRFLINPILRVSSDSNTNHPCVPFTKSFTSFCREYYLFRAFHYFKNSVISIFIIFIPEPSSGKKFPNIINSVRII